MTPERLGLLWGVTVFAGASARLLAALSGLPGVVLLLLSGLLIGRSGLGLVEPLDLGQGLATVVGLLVSLVLFDGGLNLRLPGRRVRAMFDVHPIKGHRALPYRTGCTLPSGGSE